MCEAVFIFFGTLLLWLGITGITNGEEKNNHNSSFINMGILLSIIGSIFMIGGLMVRVLLVQILVLLLHSIYNQIVEQHKVKCEIG